MTTKNFELRLSMPIIVEAESVEDAINVAMSDLWYNVEEAGLIAQPVSEKRLAIYDAVAARREEVREGDGTPPIGEAPTRSDRDALREMLSPHITSDDVYCALMDERIQLVHVGEHFTEDWEGNPVDQATLDGCFDLGIIAAALNKILFEKRRR